MHLMKWIECKVRLPEKTGVYLCVLTISMEELGIDETNEKSFSPGLPDKDYQICQYYDEDDQYFHHRVFPYEVTHWMELPPFHVMV